MVHTKDRGTMTERTSRCETVGLTAKEVLNFASSLLLPLMLGIFTVVITFQQQKAANEQRLEDRRLAQQQREQDLNISIIQRQEDRQSAQDQREQDLNNWAYQREQDMNISRQQRELDRQLADEKRQQDYELANVSRIIAQEQRDHELDVELQRHRDSLLVAYMNELGLLLDKHNGTVTSNPVIAALVRAKTLTLVRQLDPIRNSHLIRFLYEAGQLTDGDEPLDLSTAELNNIDLSTRTRNSQMHRLYLSGTFLNNASFAHQDLTKANFRQSQLNGAIFKNAILHDVNFAESTLDYSDLSHAQLLNVNAVRSSFNQATMVSAKFTSANFSFATLANIDATKSIGNNAYFIHSDLSFSKFSSATLYGSNFIYASLDYSDLSQTNLAKTNLALTSLTYSQLVYANLSGSDLYMTNLSNANMLGASYQSTQIQYAISIEKMTSTVGSIEHDIPIIKNGRFDCNIKPGPEFGWRMIERSDVTVRSFKNDSHNCYVRPTSKNNAAMRIYQLLDFGGKFRKLFDQQRGIALAVARFGTHTRVDINLIGFSNSESNYENVVRKYTISLQL